MTKARLDPEHLIEVIKYGHISVESCWRYIVDYYDRNRMRGDFYQGRQYIWDIKNQPWDPDLIYEKYHLSPSPEDHFVELHIWAPEDFLFQYIDIDEEFDPIEHTHAIMSLNKSFGSHIVTCVEETFVIANTSDLDQLITKKWLQFQRRCIKQVCTA